MTDLATNILDDGDNLDILRRCLPDAGVDLVYLDPPLATDAQLLAFEDTWPDRLRTSEGGRRCRST